MNNYNKTLNHLILNRRYRKLKGLSRMDNHDTRNIVYTTHSTKTNKISHKTQKTKKMSNTIPPKTGGDLDIRGNLSS